MVAVMWMGERREERGHWTPKTLGEAKLSFFSIFILLRKLRTGDVVQW
jgi:hypothetical protein